MLIPHILNDKVTISTAERTSSARTRFLVRAVLQHGAITSVFGRTVSATDGRKIMALAADFDRYKKAMAGVEHSNLAAAATALQSDPKMQSIALAQSQYLKSTIVFEIILSDYENQEFPIRFAPELSIDLYRQCYERLALGGGIALITTDIEFGSLKRQSPHHRECIFDAAYELHLRNGDISEAAVFLLKAFNAKKTRERLFGLLEFSMKIKKPEYAVFAFFFLSNQIELSLRQLAIFGVAFADPGQFSDAKDTLAQLSEMTDVTAERYAHRLSKYIEGQSHGDTL